jgi:hypothetical protein
VRECWRFAETGKCEVKGCREPHVLRRVHTASEDETERGDEEADEDEAEEEESAVERHEAEQVFGTAGSKRPRHESTDGAFPSAAPLGISGAAGRRLTKKLKKRDSEGGFSQQHDFVQLVMPLSDDEGQDDDDEEDEMSVESEDLDSDDSEEAGREAEADEAEGTDAAADAREDDSFRDSQHPPIATSASTAPLDSPPSGDDYVEFDYGDEDPASEEDETVEQLLRR